MSQESSSVSPSSPFAVPPAVESQVRLLFRTAIVVFLITVGIGILNGLDLVEFGRDTVLTHVHAGTIGWISLSVFAFTLWLMDEHSALGRGSALLAAGSVPLYIAAWWTGGLAFKSITGTLVLLAVFGFTAYAIVSYPRSERRAPHLAAVLALVTLSIGSTLGVLMQIQLASGTRFLPGEPIGGHAGAQVVGFLVLIGMAIAEWRLLPDAPLTKPARTQVVLLFVAGLTAALGALTGAEALLGAFIPLEIAALVIFVVRIRRRFLAVAWSSPGEERLFGLLPPFLVANVTLLIVLLSGVISGRYEDFTAIPPWLVFAFDHAMFIGVMTNGLLAFGMLLSGRRRDVAWADDVAFWGINGGLLVFVLGLLLDAAVVKRIGAPIMGTSILVGLYAVWIRLGIRPAPAADPEPALNP